MLCPEVWDFRAPSNDVTIHSGDPSYFIHCENLIKNHHFNHNVSVVIPGFLKIPEDLIKELNNDCQYYKVNLPVAQFIEKNFIDLFVKSGELSALTIGTRIDIDDCACITPTGLLVLSLARETYQKLGLEGSPLDKSSSNPERYAVWIDLRRECFKPGKPNYDRVHKCLSQFVPLQFDFVMAWEPPAGKGICPSSLASYLYNKGHDVRLCEPVFSYKSEKNVMVPSLKQTPPEEIIEWLGAFCLGILKKDPNILESSSDYLSRYESPCECEKISQVLMLQWKGFFTSKRISQFFSKLRNCVSYEEITNIPWFSLNVIGFSDSPVSWDSKYHSFHTSGDNHYTIFIKPDEHLLTFQVSPNISKNQNKLKKWVHIEQNVQK